MIIFVAATAWAEQRVGRRVADCGEAGRRRARSVMDVIVPSARAGRRLVAPAAHTRRPRFHLFGVLRPPGAGAPQGTHNLCAAVALPPAALLLRFENRLGHQIPGRRQTPAHQGELGPALHSLLHHLRDEAQAQRVPRLRLAR